MAGNSGGPWGGGGNSGGGGDDRDRNTGGGKRPPEGGPQLPEIDALVRKGQDQLRVLMGGRGGGNRGNGTGGGDGPQFGKGTVGLAVLGAVALWVFASVYTVKPESNRSNCFWVNITRPAIRV